jgi:hypothetical protein
MNLRISVLFSQLGSPVFAILFCLAGESACRAADLDQKIDAEMIWNGALKTGTLPGGIDSVIDPAAGSKPAQFHEVAAGTRVLGLTKFRWELDWRRQKQSGVYFVLRPDSRLPRGESPQPSVSREFDSRSGSSYKPTPELQLLDSYYFRATIGEQLSGRVGVMEAMAPVRVAYPVTADFSLRVRLPEKFYGVQLDWTVPGSIVGQGSHVASRRFEYKLIGYSQDGDRGENYVQPTGHSDGAPGVDTPNIGAAAGVVWHAPELLSLELLGGLQTAPSSDGKVHETFASFVASRRFILLGRNGSIIGDFRHAQESWSESTAKRLRQSSVSVSGSLALSTATRVVTGVQYGSSERFSDETRANINFYRGYQAEAGLRSLIRDGLDWGLLYVHETRRRSGDFSVSSSGAEDQTPGVARRVSMSLNYLIGTSS